MTRHLDGPLYYDVLGPAGAPPMLFIHPNPMDGSSWIFQMAHFSTWFRCVAVDLPGYGRSPRSVPGLTMDDLADACWDVLDRESSEPAVLVGCSIGSYIAQYMYHRQPERTRAIVLCGAGWRPAKAFPARRIAEYREHGLGYRYDYTLQDFAPAFRSQPIARWFAQLFVERNDSSDLESIIRTFEAVEPPDPDWLQHDLQVAVLILSGSEDPTGEAVPALEARLPDARLIVLDGAGHACYIEQPARFDSEMSEFLRKQAAIS